MENDKNKIKEPFTPENTPNPPQIIDPNKQSDEPMEKEPIKAKAPGANQTEQREKKRPSDPEKEEQHLDKSATEAADEATN